MTAERTFGPGVTWLAEATGREPAELLADRGALLAALGTAARDGVDLMTRLESADPTVRRRAEVEARALRTRMAFDHDTPRQRLLRNLTAAVRAATPGSRPEQRP